MPHNTTVNLNICDFSMQMSIRFYLISRDKKFANQLSVHLLITR